MKTVRFVVGTTLVTAGVGAAACGGKLTVGFDDAGNYHTPDGAILARGSACIEWDASHETTGASLTCDLSNDQCNLWFGPPRWPFAYTCYDMRWAASISKRASNVGSSGSLRGNHRHLMLLSTRRDEQLREFDSRPRASADLRNRHQLTHQTPSPADRVCRHTHVRRAVIGDLR